MVRIFVVCSTAWLEKLLNVAQHG